MNTIKIETFEEIHHVCLMYGLKNAYCRFPFLTDNTLASPPPVRRNPSRAGLPIFLKRNPVNVLYYDRDLRVVFDENRIASKEAEEFAKAIIDEYLTLRHPYMKAVWNGRSLLESASEHLLARIITSSPRTDDRP